MPSASKMESCSNQVTQATNAIHPLSLPMPKQDDMDDDSEYMNMSDAEKGSYLYESARMLFRVCPGARAAVDFYLGCDLSQGLTDLGFHLDVRSTQVIEIGWIRTFTYFVQTVMFEDEGVATLLFDLFCFRGIYDFWIEECSPELFMDDVYLQLERTLNRGRKSPGAPLTWFSMGFLGFFYGFSMVFYGFLGF